MAEIIDIKTGEALDTIQEWEKRIITPEEVLEVLGTQPQSKWNNLAWKLALRKINALFQELHQWTITARNWSEKITFDDINIAMIIIQNLESIPKNNFTLNNLAIRKDFLINAGIQIIAEYFGVRELDEWKRREQVFTLYNRYASSIQWNIRKPTPDEITAEKSKKTPKEIIEWIQRKNS